MKVREAAELLNVGQDRIRALMADGELPYVDIGRFTRRIPREALADYVERQTVRAAPSLGFRSTPPPPSPAPHGRPPATTTPDRPRQGSRTGPRGPWKRDRFRPRPTDQAANGP